MSGPVNETSTPSLKRATLFSAGGAVAYGATLILMDVALANRYGTGAQAAVYQAAYMIPAVMIGMLSGGAILGSFVPAFMRLGAVERQPEAAAFLRSSAGTVLVVLVPLVLLLICVAPLLAKGVASGFDDASRNEVARGQRVMFAMLIPHGIAYVYSSSLLSIGRVGAANLAPILIPLAGLATYPWWGVHDGAELIGFGYVAGSFIMAATLGLLLKLEGFGVTPTHPDRS